MRQVCWEWKLLQVTAWRGQTVTSLAVLVRRRAGQLVFHLFPLLPLLLLPLLRMVASEATRGSMAALQQRLMAMEWTQVQTPHRLGRAAARTPAAQQAPGLRAAVAVSAASAAALPPRRVGAPGVARLQAAAGLKSGAAAAAAVPAPPPPPPPVRQTGKLLARAGTAALPAPSSMQCTRQ
jgi:hypothetical protein